MTKYDINYRKVDKEQQEKQQSYIKDLANKSSRSKIEVDTFEITFAEVIYPLFNQRRSLRIIVAFM